MLTRYKLGTQFTLILVLVFIVGMAISYAILSRALEQRAEEEISARGQTLIDVMSAVRKYTSTQVNPLLAPMLTTQTDFVKESVPAFSARQVFGNLRQNAAYSDFFYKEATINPTNPDDQADDFETALVNTFSSDTSLKQQVGYRTVNGETLFYSARPLAITADTCLKCHSTPDAAPASLITTYGDHGGFGWTVGQIIAAQIVYVPAADVFASAQQSLLLGMTAFAVIMVLVILLINFLLRRMVVRPVQQMGVLAGKISADTVSAIELDQPELARLAQRKDEIGQSVSLFQRMAREVVAREKRLIQQVARLKIEIDESKKTQQVEEITESDYFKTLQVKVRNLRSQNEDHQGKSP
jgi:methyl-accepting chemotaxis protein